MKFNKIKSLQKSEPKDIIHLTVGGNHNFFANNLCLHNCQYRGEIKVILHNASKEEFFVTKGMRIAQMVICELPSVSLVEVSELGNTERGPDGFGSTGI